MKNLQILILENGICTMSFPKNRIKLQHIKPVQDTFYHISLPFDASSAPWIKQPLRKKIAKLPICGTLADPKLSFLNLPTPQDAKDGYALYRALLFPLVSSILSLLFPSGGTRAVIDCSQPINLFPLLAPAFREIVILCPMQDREAYAQELLCTFGVAPIFMSQIPPCDFLITDQKLSGSSEPISCVLSFAGHFPHARRRIDHNRILLKPQAALRTALPDFVKELPLSEGAAVLSATEHIFSPAHFLPRPLFALSDKA